MKTFFAKLAGILLASTMCVGYATAQVKVQTPTMEVGDAWSYQENLNVSREEVFRTEGTTAFARRVTIAPDGKKTELSLVYDAGVRQGGFNRCLQFPFAVGDTWGGHGGTVRVPESTKRKS